MLFACHIMRENIVANWSAFVYIYLFIYTFVGIYVRSTAFVNSGGEVWRRRGAACPPAGICEDWRRHRACLLTRPLSLKYSVLVVWRRRNAACPFTAHV